MDGRPQKFLYGEASSEKPRNKEEKPPMMKKTPIRRKGLSQGEKSPPPSYMGAHDSTEF